MPRRERHRHSPSLSANLAQLLLAGFQAVGVDAEAVLAHAGLTRAALAGQGGRVPAKVLHDLFDAAVAVSGGPGVGVRIAEMTLIETFGEVGFIARSSDTLGDAVARWGRYFGLLLDFLQIEVVREGDRATIRLHTDRPELVHPEQQEFVFRMVQRFTEKLTGEPLVPIEGWARGEPRRDPAEYRAIFGCPMRFSMPDAGVVVEAEVLLRPVTTRDPALCALLERHARQLLETQRRSTPYATKVREEIALRLREGQPGASDIARRLGLSAKTLSRRLRDEGTSFARVLDQVRHELALSYLHEHTMSVAEVAYALGFAQPTTFTRAFRKWTRLTPQEFRNGEG